MPSVPSAAEPGRGGIPRSHHVSVRHELFFYSERARGAGTAARRTRHSPDRGLPGQVLGPAAVHREQHLLGRVIRAVRGRLQGRAGAGRNQPSDTSSVQHNSADDCGRQPRWKRVLAYIRRGFTATVVVLGILGIATGVWALHLRPDDAIPQPESSSMRVIQAVEKKCRATTAEMVSGNVARGRR
jgi:hypothetical protein